MNPPLGSWTYGYTKKKKKLHFFELGTYGTVTVTNSKVWSSASLYYFVV